MKKVLLLMLILVPFNLAYTEECKKCVRTKDCGASGRVCLRGVFELF